MQQSPMITVILPVYNVADYLKECLNSLLKQTYKDFELIVVNDGSTDNSLDIVNQYTDKFEKIIVITQKNKGLSEARNAGYSHIKGKYTYFLDSDDFILPNTFENLVDLAEKNQLDLIKFDAYSFAEKDVNIQMTNYDSSGYLQENTVYSRDEYLNKVENNFMPAVWMYFIKSAIILEQKLYFIKDILHEDEVFTVQLLKHCRRIMYDSNQYFQRRYRQNSIMTANVSKNKKSTQSKIEIIELFQNMIDSHPADKAYNQFVKSRQSDIFTVLIFEKNGKIKPYLKYYKQYKLSIKKRTALRHIKKNLISLK